MEKEEIERTLQFVLNQQAQFISDLQQLREVQSVQQGQIGKLTDAFVMITGFVGRIAEAQVRLAEQQEKFAKQQAEFAKQLAEFARSHAELEERFNAFVTFMERYLSDKGDGHK